MSSPLGKRLGDMLETLTAATTKLQEYAKKPGIDQDDLNAIQRFQGIIGTLGGAIMEQERLKEPRKILVLEAAVKALNAELSEVG